MDELFIVVLGGLGYWGKNLVRCFQRLATVLVVDPTHSQSHNRSLEALIASHDGKPTGIVVATPPDTHCDLALEALEHTQHVLIEKPMVLTKPESQLLEPYAEQIMVDHTFLYVPEFEHIKQVLDYGELGEPLYAYSDRLNLGKFQPCGVTWDLAPHDLALFQWLFDERPKMVSSLESCVRYDRPDVSRLNLQYGPVQTHLHMSWIHPTKVRKTTIVCTKGMIVYDMLAEEKIKIYHPAREVGERDVTESYGDYLMRYRGGDIVSPAVEQHEPLMAMCTEFVKFCRGGQTRSGFSLGRDVVDVLCEVEDE